MLDELKAIYRIEIGQPHKAVKPTCPCTQLDTICGAHLPNGDMLAGESIFPCIWSSGVLRKVEMMFRSQRHGTVGGVGACGASAVHDFTHNRRAIALPNPLRRVEIGDRGHGVAEVPGHSG